MSQRSRVCPVVPAACPSPEPTAKMAGRRSSALLVLLACTVAFCGLRSAFVAAPGQALRGAEASMMSCNQSQFSYPNSHSA